MGSQWFINMAGISLDDEGMKKIPHPRKELALHVTTKTVEVAQWDVVFDGKGVDLQRYSVHDKFY